MTLLIKGLIGPLMLTDEYKKFYEQKNSIIDAFNEDNLQDVIEFVEKYKDEYILSWLIGQIIKVSRMSKENIEKLKSLYLS